MTRQELKRVKELLTNGSVVPHPRWGKYSQLKGCQRLYHEVELLRKYILEKLVR